MPSKLSLYDISLEGMQIADILEASEGELTPEVEERLDALMQAGPERIEAAAMVVRNLEASDVACKVEAQRLVQRAQSFASNAQRLKERIAIALDAAFSGKVKTDRFTIYTQKAPDTVAFDLKEEFTLEMLKEDYPGLVRTKLELDKQECKIRFAEGKLPEAIFVEQNAGKRYTRIK
jgi:hypothetical protein